MPQAIIVIDHQPGRGLAMQINGNGPNGSLVHTLALAAVAAMDEEMKKLEGTGEFGPPMVGGSERSLDQSVYRDAERLQPPEGPEYWAT